jgi:hypothetical protein
MNTVERARGRWKAILPVLGIETRPNKHGPCPLCGGVDRYAERELDRVLDAITCPPKKFAAFGAGQRRAIARITHRLADRHRRHPKSRARYWSRPSAWGSTPMQHSAWPAQS